MEISRINQYDFAKKNTFLPENAPNTSAKKDKDSVELTSGKCLPRRIIEKTAGFVTGFIPAASYAAGGLAGGGIAALIHNRETREMEAEKGVHAGNTLFYTALGMGAALALSTGLMGVVFGCGLGFGIGIELDEKYVTEGISKKIAEESAQTTADNIPSENKIRDTIRNFTEGAFIGAATGAKEGLKWGSSLGEGFIAGIIDGIKDSF